MNTLASRSAVFRSDLAAAVEVLFEPRRTFRAILPRSPLLAPWLVASALTVALTFPIVSISQRASAHLLADLPESANTAEVGAQLDRMKIVAVVSAPFSLAVRWAANALLLWAPGVLLSGAVRLRPVATIVAYSAIPSVLGTALDLLVTWVEGPEFTPSMLPSMSSATSLAWLWPGEASSSWTLALLEHVTPFTLWGLALWMIGAREGFGLSWPRAVAMTAPIWVAGVAASASMDVLGASLLGTLPSPAP